MNMQINDFMVRKQAMEYSSAVNRDKFSMTPITANAPYEPDANAVYIIPGMIGDILYNSNMPIEEVYGKLGFVIGHEIAHSFDPIGANYDEI